MSEAHRLKYRYLDLRRQGMQDRLRLRHEVARRVRAHLDGEGFIEVETPILTRSTPEGARDYLVPSRVQRGAFYALPQSPQLFKQILMVGGVDRYYQIARCFRDEDLRADRQPEFTQVDLEMSFVTASDVMGVVEPMVADLFTMVRGHETPRPFPVMSHADAMLRYGTDRPDLRVVLELADFSDCFAGTAFRVFAEAMAQGRRVRGLVAVDLYQLDMGGVVDFLDGIEADATRLLEAGCGIRDGGLDESVDMFRLDLDVDVDDVHTSRIGLRALTSHSSG